MLGKIQLELHLRHFIGIDLRFDTSYVCSIQPVGFFFRYREAVYAYRPVMGGGQR